MAQSTAVQPGTGWTETYMGGSLEAERALFAQILPQVDRIQDLVARKQQADPRRAFHNKGVAVALRIEVSNDVPEAMQVGFLRPGATYEGFGRFSRSQSFRGSDGELDQRGFACRLVTDAGLQDLLFSNKPASFATDPVQFMKVTTIFAESSKVIAPLRVILALGIREGIRVVANLVRAPDRKTTFTSQRYWSRTAFQFGDVAARLFVRPTSGPVRVEGSDGPDFLSSDLKADLRERSRSFDLCAQLFVDERRTPIEDSVVPGPNRSRLRSFSGPSSSSSRISTAPSLKASPSESKRRRRSIPGLRPLFGRSGD